MTINNFILDHYTILYKGDQVDLNNLEAVEEFILTDDHADLGVQLVHSVFINSFFNQPESTVYIESQPSDTPLSEDAKQVMWLDKDIDARGWDIGTIETIFLAGLLQTGKTIQVDIGKAKKLFFSLELSKTNLEQYRLTLKKFMDGQKNIQTAKNELINNFQQAQKIKFDDNLLFNVVDTTFLSRQVSLRNAWSQKGRKALVVGELHLYKDNENSSSLFDRDPKLSNGLAGRTFIQEFAKGRNAMVLRAKPQVSASYFNATFGPLMADVATFFANEAYKNADIY